MTFRMLAAALGCLALTGLALADKEKTERKIPYKVDHKAPLDAAEQIVKEADDHTQFRVEFNGVKGDRVPGYLYVPKSKGKHSAVLLQYGSGGNKNTDYIVAIGKQFVRHGLVVLTIDSIGRGERKLKEEPKNGGRRGFDLASETFVEAFRQYMGDYGRAVDFLVTRAEVDKERIGYMGISWGAITGVPYTAHDERIKAVVSMVGGGGFISMNSENGKLKELAKDLDPVFHVGQIAPRPLLLLNVTKDQLVPRPYAEKLHKAAGKNSKIIWLETDHYFRGIDRDKVLEETVIKFLDDNLAGKLAGK